MPSPKRPREGAVERVARAGCVDHVDAETSLDMNVCRAPVQHRALGAAGHHDRVRDPKQRVDATDPCGFTLVRRHDRPTEQRRHVPDTPDNRGRVHDHADLARPPT